MARAQINISPATYAAIAEMAQRLGYTQKGGPRAGQGSPVKMLEALARGELEVIGKKRGEQNADKSANEP